MTDTLTEVTKLWGDNPFELVKAFGLNPDPHWTGKGKKLTVHQFDILKAYWEGLYSSSDDPNRFMSVKSGQGGGKTFIENIIAGHWLVHAKGARMRVFATSMDQLKDVWMAEFRQLLERSPVKDLLQEMYQVRAKDILFCGDPDWCIRMMTAKSPETTQGRHHDHLGIIVDEISGVERGILETILGTVTNDDKFVGLFGNPNSRDTFQFDTFNSLREDWWCYTINCEESPIADQNNIKRLERQYGRESDVYRVRVMGEFPSIDPQSLMSSDDIEACMRQDGRKLELVSRGGRQIGIDFARAGSDESVIVQRSGGAVLNMKRYSHWEPLAVAGEAFDLARRHGWRDGDVLYVPDADGLGGGAMGVFQGHKHHEFHASGSAMDSIYEDSITEAYFHMRHLVMQRECLLPHDVRLIKELSTRRYSILPKGTIKLEPKEHWKKRMEDRQSTDRADATVQAFYDCESFEGKALDYSESDEVIKRSYALKDMLKRKPGADEGPVGKVASYDTAEERDIYTLRGWIS